MQALVIREPGGPEVLELRTVPDPRPGPGDLLVRVRAAGLNRADVLQRRGHYPPPADAPPDIPGLEFAGTVAALGPGPGAWKIDDRVMGLCGGGAHAQALCVAAGSCLPIPAGLKWTAAAAIPEAFVTAYDALFLQARLAPGETVLITAAASGVGTAAVQLAAVAGARVIGSSRSAHKHARLAALGCHAVLDASAADAAARIRELTGVRGVDLVLDLVGASQLALEVLSERGRIVLLGLLAGRRAELDLGVLLHRRADLRGSVLRSRGRAEKAALVAACAPLLRLFDEGRIAPVVDRVLPLARAAEAHALMEAGDTFGKIVLEVAA